MYRTPIIIVSALIVLPAVAGSKGAQKICFDNGGVADYRADGSYQYSGTGGNFTGKWKLLGARRYQINFDNGNSRVDTYDTLGGGNVMDHGPQGNFSGHQC